MARKIRATQSETIRIHSTKNFLALQSLFQKIFPVFFHILSNFPSLSRASPSGAKNGRFLRPRIKSATVFSAGQTNHAELGLAVMPTVLHRADSGSTAANRVFLRTAAFSCLTDKKGRALRAQPFTHAKHKRIACAAGAGGQTAPALATR
ncbi:hypothetical protein [Pseudoflavonifractor phocaeensis]|uniref:hypothetical protein n=1 Tax=Pseudoflavonifractor phocaeensis TaxID=1870988 RepID=UPI001F21ED44|nr:hypothetical protein [Pseudoflavonifractor phocaeensis]MCF2596262.1 hypothetical protein [Pseudoflavonifractor phocaeensis]